MERSEKYLLSETDNNRGSDRLDRGRYVTDFAETQWPNSFHSISNICLSNVLSRSLTYIYAFNVTGYAVYYPSPPYMVCYCTIT